MSAPRPADFPAPDFRTTSFQATVWEFTDEAYVGMAGAWFAADLHPNDTYAVATTLDPDQVMRVEKGTDNILSGKSTFRTPEPPTLVMLLIGAGLISGFYWSRQVSHRLGRRKVRAESRKMARI